MNGKIFPILAIVGSSAISTNIVGTTFAEKKIQGDQGASCSSEKTRQNPEGDGEFCHSFGHKSTTLCGTSPTDRDLN